MSQRDIDAIVAFWLGDSLGSPEAAFGRRDWWYKGGTPVDDELKAGQISVHSDLLLHGSAANESDRRRCGLTLRYCAADVRAHMGWNEKGVIVSGQDTSGHWPNPPRPEQD